MKEELKKYEIEQMPSIRIDIAPLNQTSEQIFRKERTIHIWIKKNVKKLLGKIGSYIIGDVKGRISNSDVAEGYYFNFGRREIILTEGVYISYGDPIIFSKLLANEEVKPKNKEEKFIEALLNFFNKSGITYCSDIVAKISKEYNLNPREAERMLEGFISEIQNSFEGNKEIYDTLDSIHQNIFPSRYKNNIEDIAKKTLIVGVWKKDENLKEPILYLRDIVNELVLDVKKYENNERNLYLKAYKLIAEIIRNEDKKYNFISVENKKIAKELEEILSEHDFKVKKTPLRI